MNRIDSSDKLSDEHLLWRLWCRFYPLAMTDFAMTLGDMFRPMALSRLPHAEISLAAIGVIKSIAVFFESPIIMLLHASTALSSNKNSHRALWHFMLLLCGIITSIFLAFCYQPIYQWLFIGLFGVSEEIARVAQLPFILMIPWPALIAIRRFYQGILICDHQEKPMATAGIIRLLFTIILLWLGVFFDLEGTLVGALSLIGAVAIEAMTIIYFSYRTPRKSIAQANQQALLPSNVASVARYYAPLGATSTIVWGSRALLVGVIARAPDGILSIAIWTTAMGFVLPVANATRMVQQIVISSITIPRWILLRFSMLIGVASCFVLLVIGFTTPGTLVLKGLLGDNSSIAIASVLVIQICLFLPILTALQNTYQGFLILSGAHWWINVATLINVAVSLILAMILISLKYSGTVAAAIATVLGLSLEVGILIVRNKILTDPWEPNP